MTRSQPAVWRLLAAFLAAVAPTTFTVGPASADPTSEPALIAPSKVWINARTTISATVCARGWVDDGTPIFGVWLFRVLGTTSLHMDDHYGATFPESCYTVSTNGTAAGVADVSLTYFGVHGDALAACSAVVQWSPGWPIDGLASACTGIPPA